MLPGPAGRVSIAVLQGSVGRLPAGAGRKGREIKDRMEGSTGGEKGKGGKVGPQELTLTDVISVTR